MIWKIDNKPGFRYAVSGEPSPQVYESWTVVEDCKKYGVKHTVNDVHSGSYEQSFLPQRFESIQDAISALWESIPKDNAVFGIPKADFTSLKSKYPDCIWRSLYKHEFNGKVCKAGDWMSFASVLTGNYNNETELIFEHIHFEIV